jgi:hypothetical protein
MGRKKLENLLESHFAELALLDATNEETVGTREAGDHKRPAEHP